MIKQISLIGLGLIASSIAKKLVLNNDNVKIVGYDNLESVRQIVNKFGIMQVHHKLKDAVKDSDLIILCVPVG